MHQNFGRQNRREEYRGNYRNEDFSRERARSRSRERSFSKNIDNRRNNRSISNSRSRFGWRARTNRVRIRCYKCREYDHFVKDCPTWCRFLILLVESWRKVIISGTVHWFWLKTSFHPLLWTSSGLTGSWKLSTYIRFGSLRSVKSVKTRGNWKPKKCWKC